MFDKSKLWAVGLLFAAFAAGVAVGGTASTMFGGRDHGRNRESRPPRSRQETSYLERLDRDLTLRPGQRDSVATILKRYDEPMREIWRRERHQVDSMRLQVRTEIAALLDQRQREQFRLMNQRVDSLRAVRERGGAPRGR